MPYITSVPDSNACAAAGSRKEINMTYTYVRRARYHETDKMGVIHHSNYLKWMEEARTDMMDEIGIGYGAVEKRGIVSPVVSVLIDFKKSIRFDDVVEIKTEILKYTGTSLIVGYEFFNRTTGEICTAAQSKHCFLSEGKIISLKRSFPELDRLISDYAAEQ